MRILIGGDHAGFHLKQEIARYLSEAGHEVLDAGAASYDPGDDYPDFSLAVARGVASGQAERGVIICGSGVGAAIAANKVRGSRACLCHDTYSARQGVEHDAMNVLCLGGRIVGAALAMEIVRAFLSASFSAEERHQRRLDKVLAAEAEAQLKT